MQLMWWLVIEKGSEFKYAEIQRELESFVASASPGAKLPSERELARSFDCNVLTIRKALEPLAKSGLIVKRAGSGSFVADASGPQAERSLKLLGVLIHSESDAYGMEVLRSVNASASARGLDLRSRWIKDYRDEALIAAKALAGEGCCALLVPWLPASQVASLPSFAKASPLPLSVPLLVPGMEDSCFEVPALYGKGASFQVESACEYFRLLSPDPIALVGPDSLDDMVMQSRTAAYSRFVFRHGMENLSCPVASDPAAMDALAASFAKRRGRLSVFCHDDLHALRLLTAMHKLGLSAPGDFRILGCNDSDGAKFADPPLSSLAIDWAYPGEALVRNALGLASGKPDQSERGPAHRLVLRRSCGGFARINELEGIAASCSLLLEVES